MASASRKHGVGRGPPVLIRTGEVGNLRLRFPRGWEASGCVRFRPPVFSLSRALDNDTLFPRWVLCERHPGSRSTTLQLGRGAAVLGSGRRGADPAAILQAPWGGRTGGVPTGRGRRCDWHRLGPRLAATLREARPRPRPHPPLGSGGELRSRNSSGTDPKTFPRAPCSFCLSGQRRRRLSCDRLVLVSLTVSHRYCGRAGVLSLPAFDGGGRVPQMRESGRPHPGLTHPPAVNARHSQLEPREDGVWDLGCPRLSRFRLTPPTPPPPTLVPGGAHRRDSCWSEEPREATEAPRHGAQDRWGDHQGAEGFAEAGGRTLQWYSGFM